MGNGSCVFANLLLNFTTGLAGFVSLIKPVILNLLPKIAVRAADVPEPCPHR